MFSGNVTLMMQWLRGRRLVQDNLEAVRLHILGEASPREGHRFDILYKFGMANWIS